MERETMTTPDGKRETPISDLAEQSLAHHCNSDEYSGLVTKQTAIDLELKLAAAQQEVKRLRAGNELLLKDRDYLEDLLSQIADGEDLTASEMRCIARI